MPMPPAELLHRYRLRARRARGLGRPCTRRVIVGVPRRSSKAPEDAEAASYSAQLAPLPDAAVVPAGRHASAPRPRGRAARASPPSAIASLPPLAGSGVRRRAAAARRGAAALAPEADRAAAERRSADARDARARAARRARARARAARVSRSEALPANVSIQLRAHLARSPTAAPSTTWKREGDSYAISGEAEADGLLHAVPRGPHPAGKPRHGDRARACSPSASSSASPARARGRPRASTGTKRKVTFDRNDETKPGQLADNTRRLALDDLPARARAAPGRDASSCRSTPSASCTRSS